MAATEPVPVVTPEQIVEREAAQKPRVGFAALAAAVLAVIAGVLPQSVLSDFPRVYTLDALRDAAGESIGRDGLRTAQVLFLDDHSSALLLVAICQGVSLALIGLLLVFLYDASVIRGATTPRAARILAIFGGGAGAICTIALQIGLMISASDFASSSDHSTKAAHEALRGGVVAIAGSVGLLASLAFAAAFVLITIGGMRVGLLTRFLGVLGAIVGALILLGPLSGSPTFIVQAFWLAMVGVLLFGRWPGAGVPAAWTDGEARPWPTQQEIREAKDRSRGRGEYTTNKSPGPAKPAAGGSASNGGASPATAARKKRKRR
jgi:hypothetical protein